MFIFCQNCVLCECRASLAAFKEIRKYVLPFQTRDARTGLDKVGFNRDAFVKIEEMLSGNANFGK